MRKLRSLAYSPVRFLAWLCLFSACLTRPVGTGAPTVKSSFSTRAPSRGVDKIDLLLAIDNSGSMGDKQKFLAEAVPELLARLVAPNCLDANKQVTGRTKAFEDDGFGTFGCPAGSKPEYQPIVDIHIGIVSSSVTNGGACLNTPAIDRGVEIFAASDNAHLVERARDANDKDIAAPLREAGGFLAWFPEVKRNARKAHPEHPYTDLDALTTSFQSLIRGVGEKGCGFEAQLEAVYRFLSQPDPFEDISVQNNTASLVGVDKTVLRQRAAFLRPDSLVAVVMVTDEDDASFDPMLYSGQGFLYSVDHAAFQPARGTSVCATDPASPDCQSCELVSKQKDYEYLSGDPNCALPAYEPNDDKPNVRSFNQKQRFGVDAYYPIARYRTGFLSRSVPDRSTEHGPRSTKHRESVYRTDADAAKCTNPLYAAALPVDVQEERTPQGVMQYAVGADGKVMLQKDGTKATLCTLPRGERDPSNVYFAIIAGVPNELIQKDKDGLLSEAQWASIVGKDPEQYNLEGIDARMLPSIEKRQGRPLGPEDAPASDPLNGGHREWDTVKNDLQYACTFPLAPSLQKPASQSGDCSDGSDAPLCSAPKGTLNRKQVRAKAFPGIRELALAHSLGDQGIVASICPTESVNKGPTYGYNPAVSGIVDRLASSFRQCLPHELTRDPETGVSCRMLEVLPEREQTCASVGAAKPDEKVEGYFREAQRREGTTLGLGEICEIPQFMIKPGEQCQGNPEAKKAWCYVSDRPEASCAFGVEFGPEAITVGANVYIQCIDQR